MRQRRDTGLTGWPYLKSLISQNSGGRGTKSDRATEVCRDFACLCTRYLWIHLCAGDATIRHVPETVHEARFVTLPAALVVRS